MTSGTQAKKPKKRGRKRKTEEVSVISVGKGAIAAADAASAAGQAGEEEGEEEDDGDENEGVVGDQERHQRRKEKADLGLLVEHFNPSQLDRYASMRRNKLRKEVVRKIVNQTLSQSVPPSIITGISGYTKTLIGLLIERARDVQEQNAVAASGYPSPPSRPQSSKTVQGGSSQETALPSSFESGATLVNEGPFTSSPMDGQNTHADVDSDTDRPPELNHNAIFGAFSSPPRLPNPPALPKGNAKPLPSPSQQASSANDFTVSSPPGLNQLPPSQSQKPKQEELKKKKYEYLGPLLPGDLREAYRRHKRDGESAGIGQGGMSLMGIGVQGTFAAGRGKGRRLFG
ncbi:MAG: hypothetical protein Q9170_007486 [Blastenia crenularia]